MKDLTRTQIKQSSPGLAGRLARTRSGYALWAVALLPALAGCTALGPAAEILGGEPDVPAVYAPAKVKTLVMVEDFRGAANGDVDTDRLSLAIDDELKTREVAPLVDQGALEQFRQADPARYKTMSIAEIGKALGARQVIYLDVTKYSLDHPNASDRVKGSAAMKVKVIDAKSGESLWPRDATDGQPFTADTPYLKADNVAEVEARDELNSAIVKKVGRLFHSWNPEAENDEPDMQENFNQSTN